MDGSPRDRALSAISDLGSWTEAEADSYVTARHLLGELIAAYSAWLWRLPAGEERQLVLAEQHACSRRRARLTVFDRQEIHRIVEETPARIRQVQDWL